MTSRAERARARKLRNARLRELREAGILPAKPDRSGRRLPTERGDPTETVVLARIRQLGWRDTPENRKAARDERLGYELGRLEYFGQIFLGERQAGEKLAALMGKHDGMIGMPRRTPAGGRYGEAYGGAARDADEDAVRLVKAEYADALAALWGAHAKARSEVVAVAVEDRPAERLEILRLGLKALAEHFGCQGG